VYSYVFCVVLWKLTDVTEEDIPFIFKTEECVIRETSYTVLRAALFLALVLTQKMEVKRSETS
jgi:hypothetical protein